MDEDLLGWIFRFVESFASNLGRNITGVHAVILGEEIFPSKDLPSVTHAVQSYQVKMYPQESLASDLMLFDSQAAL